jgi:hypothetical protein
MRTSVVAALSLVVATFLPVVPAAQIAPSAPPPRKLELTFDGQGNVSLFASNVTVREILAEWTRLGGSRFLNVERLTGAPLQIPVQFERQPEGDVLASLLAGTSGYILGPRMVGMPGTSRFGTVVIQATSNATATTSYGPTNYGGATAPPVTRGNPDDEIAPVTPPTAPAGAPASTNTNQPAGPRPNAPSVGVPASPVIVPIGPAPPATTTPPPATTTTGRGRGGGGGSTPR